jgi:GAF domain-containing protein
LAPVLVAAPAPSPSRATAPEITEILFDSMHELSFFDTAASGGSFCLVTAMRVVPCLAGIVHLYDADAGAFVIVYARGPRAERLVLKCTPDNDELLARAWREKKAIVVEYDGDAAKPPSERHAFFGDPWSVLVVPVVHGGRVLGMIELVDPLDGAPFGEAAENALKYIAEHYGAFVADRGIALKNLVAIGE